MTPVRVAPFRKSGRRVEPGPAIFPRVRCRAGQSALVRRDCGEPILSSAAN
jgi:hypothetical protein